jgi:cell division protein FtsQ
VGRLALVHPRSVRGGFAVPWQRVSTAVGASLAVLLLLYLGARETSLFAVRTIEVSGAPPGVRQTVRATAEEVDGESLMAIDGDTLVRDLEALPSVRSVTYDRAFPRTLRIFVRPEAPLAVLKLGSDRWIVSARGRVIRRAPEAPGRLPHFRLPPRAGIEPGSFVTDPAAGVILASLSALPKQFPARIQAVRLEGGSLTFFLQAPWGAPELRLGEAVDVGAKLAAGGLVLRSLPPAERPSVGYVDVSLPERTVVGPDSQPAG